MRRELSLQDFRTVSRAATFLSVGLAAVGIYLLLEGLVPAGIAVIVLGVALMAGLSLLRIRPEPAGERLLILVSKDDCALCDEARLRLKDLPEARPFLLREVRIEEDANLRRRYRDWVPVVLWQHEELAKGQIDWDALRRRLSDIDPDVDSRPPVVRVQ